MPASSKMVINIPRRALHCIATHNSSSTFAFRSYTEVLALLTAPDQPEELRTAGSNFLMHVSHFMHTTTDSQTSSDYLDSNGIFVICSPSRSMNHLKMESTQAIINYVSTFYGSD
jgi:hypothetical protein